jgi:hypothetical protein
VSLAVPGLVQVTVALAVEQVHPVPLAETFVVDQNQVGLSSIHVVSGEFQGDNGSFAGPITYLPWYACLFPTGVEYGRAIINEGFLN